MKNTKKTPLLKIKGECSVPDVKTLFSIVGAIGFLVAIFTSNTDLLLIIIDYIIKFAASQGL